METYYDEIVKEIETLIADGSYEEASFLLKKELEMPYIPSDTEMKFHQLQRELRFAMSEKKEVHETGTDTYLQMLQGNAQQQLRAAEGLTSRNLRECLEDLRRWLMNNPLPEASAIIIEELARQGICEEFTLVRDDVTYEFYSDDVIPVVEQEGFQAANQILQETYLHQPDYYEMAKTLLIHEVYLFLPLAFDAEDAEGLAKTIQIRLSELLEVTDHTRN